MLANRPWSGHARRAMCSTVSQSPIGELFDRLSLLALRQRQQFWNALQRHCLLNESDALAFPIIERKFKR